jgi:hypothetical protein
MQLAGKVLQQCYGKCHTISSLKGRCALPIMGGRSNSLLLANVWALDGVTDSVQRCSGSIGDSVDWSPGERRSVQTGSVCREEHHAGDSTDASIPSTTPPCRHAAPSDFS